jgi:hypothetical protein
MHTDIKGGVAGFRFRHALVARPPFSGRSKLLGCRLSLVKGHGRARPLAIGALNIAREFLGVRVHRCLSAVPSASL